MNFTRARSIEALGLVVLIWSGGRASYVMLAEDGSAEISTRAPVSATPPLPRSAPRPDHIRERPKAASLFEPWQAQSRPVLTRLPTHAGRATLHADVPENIPAARMVSTSLPGDHLDHAPFPGISEPVPMTTNVPMQRQSPKLSGSAWVLWRPEALGQSLGSGGQLGGSQIGGRLILPVAVDGRLRLSIRGSAALTRPSNPELAPGISIRPLPQMPVEFIAERRFRRGSQSHHAMAVFLAGGFSTQSPDSSLKMDGYAQAGVVGFNRQLWFADGAATVRKSLTQNGDFGVGAWGGIQPGLKRLDIGPSASARIGDIRLTVDWRIRVAGDARPGSGAALTLARDF